MTDAEPTWVQVLTPGALPWIVKHWQRWFDSKGIGHAMRRTAEGGDALFRTMSAEQYKVFQEA